MIIDFPCSIFIVRPAFAVLFSPFFRCSMIHSSRTSSMLFIYFSAHCKSSNSRTAEGVEKKDISIKSKQSGNRSGQRAFTSPHSIIIPPAAAHGNCKILLPPSWGLLLLLYLKAMNSRWPFGSPTDSTHGARAGNAPFQGAKTTKHGKQLVLFILQLKPPAVHVSQPLFLCVPVRSPLQAANDLSRWSAQRSLNVTRTGQLASSGLNCMVGGPGQL